MENRSMPDALITSNETADTHRQSPEIKDLAAALVKAQAEIEGAKKDAKAVITSTQTRTYADLASVWDAIRKPLTDNGLAIVQFPRTAGNGAEIKTTILHGPTGQYMSDVLWVPCGKNDAQGLGSAITYGRRYALMAVVGVCPIDDDGEAAVASTRGAPGTAAGGGQFRPERRQASASGARMAAEEPELTANAAGTPKGTLPAAKPTNETKAKAFVDEALKFFAANKDDEDACRLWWSENTKVPAGASASPIAWLLAKAPAEHKRLQNAYEGVVGLEDAA
jgi:ERF superfamily